MDTFRVGFSNDFLDGQGKLVFPDIGLARFDRVNRLSHDFLAEYRSEYVPQQLQPYDVLISLKPRITAASLAGIERLCAIGRCGVGYDNVDLVACTGQDVAVFITPDAVVRPVAESIVLLVLALSHNLVFKDRAVRQGRWPESTRSLGRQPADRVVGTIGLGNIAAEAIHLLRPFGVKKFLAFDPYVKPGRPQELGVEMVPFDLLLSVCDFVLVNCALTPETRGLVGEREFALMKPDAVIINTARGPIVDQKALIAALRAGKLGGAGLDVFEQEPLDPASPLTTFDNVILTSHSLAWTRELFRDMGAADCEGALAVMRGEVPKSVVNPEVLERAGFKQKLARYRSCFHPQKS